MESDDRRCTAGVLNLWSSRNRGLTAFHHPLMPIDKSNIFTGHDYLVRGRCRVIYKPPCTTLSIMESRIRPPPHSVQSFGAMCSSVTGPAQRSDQRPLPKKIMVLDTAQRKALFLLWSNILLIFRAQAVATIHYSRPLVPTPPRLRLTSLLTGAVRGSG